MVIATKFGISFDKSAQEVNHPVIPNSRPEIIRASVEGSLKRLGTDRIDLYYQHRTDPNIPIEEVAGVMLELMQEGKITYWGLSEASEEVIRRAHKVCPVTAIQNRYSMMVRWHEELFSVLEELGIGFVAFSPLANGLLSARYHTDSVFDSVYDYRSVMPQFQAEALKKNENLLALLENMAQEKEVTPAQISLAWMIGKKPYIVPIPGTRNPQRMKENLKAGDVLLSEEEIKKLDAALNEMELSEVFGGSRVETRKEEEK